MKALFFIGQCVRLLNSDPWLEVTHHIEEVGIKSYLTETAYQTSGTWKFAGTNNIHFDFQKKYEVVKCPSLRWNK